jgi:hypothetical protein
VNIRRRAKLLAFFLLACSAYGQEAEAEIEAETEIDGEPGEDVKNNDGGGDFGFGLDSFDSSDISFQVSGSARLGLLFFTGGYVGAQDTGGIFKGELQFLAREGNGELHITVKADGYERKRPVDIDEAFVRLKFSKANVEGGFKKLTWGKADSNGPLDVTNPLDYSDISNITDQLGRKIAVPMVRVVYFPGDFTTLEGVFIAGFRGDRIDLEGRWTPLRIAVINELSGFLQQQGIQPNFSGAYTSLDDFYDSYNDGIRRFDYSQGGLRFTATVGAADIGFQYFSGIFFRPAISAQRVLLPGPSVDVRVHSDYNRYHQIGADYARVIAGFNTRAELALDITKDGSGDDPEIENPSLLWSLGFDRELAGITVNVQGSGSVVLMYNGIKDDTLTAPAPYGIRDCEADKKLTNTRITGILSKKFFRDELELKTTVLWGIEDRDCLVIPAATWTRNSLSLELSAGFFAGSREGELGYYRDNGFVKTVAVWKF